MIEVGDTVKVISKTTDICGEQKEFIPIGTICKVIEIDTMDNGEICIEIQPLDDEFVAFWYLSTELEKGHMEWVRDED